MAAVVRLGDWVVSSARAVWSAQELVSAQEAVDLVEQARLRALQMIEDARREAEEIRATAQAEGFRAGEIEALKQILTRLGQQEALTAAVRHFVRDAVVASVGGFLATDLDTARYRGLLESVDRSLAGWTWLKLRVAPSCVEEAAAAVGDLPQRIGSRVVVSGDESLGPGECVIESDAGWLDARIATQLERVRLAVEGCLNTAES